MKKQFFELPENHMKRPIGISPARLPANHEQAKQALTPVQISQLAPDQLGQVKIPMLYIRTILFFGLCLFQTEIFDYNFSSMSTAFNHKCLVKSLLHIILWASFVLTDRNEYITELFCFTPSLQRINVYFTNDVEL